LQDIMAQWLWFVFNIEKERIGYDKGLLTWLRLRKHRKLRRHIHICLLDVYPKGGKFGRFMAFWINERSRVCSASLNERIEEADIVWIYSQDPLPSDVKEELLNTIKRSREGTKVINHPDFYNSYHSEHTFRALAEAGVNVPRSEFTEEDINKTLVVYKTVGRHSAPKNLSLFRGSIESFQPFEFIDSRDSDGLYRKYRALYINGIVYPDYLLFSSQWNVCWSLKNHADFTFEMTPVEIESIHIVAKKLNLQFFSIDYIRRNSDGHPVFTDINVYPMPIAYAEIIHQYGYYGRWYECGNPLRFGMPESSGRPFWEIFDNAMVSFANKKM